MPEKKNILIIGGNSFVGRSFRSYHKGFYTIKSVIRSGVADKNFFLVPDLNNISDEIFKGLDVVINCAAIVHQSRNIPSFQYNSINHELALHLAKKAKSNGVTHFIQLSTIAVYGNAEEINLKTPENPVSDYGKSKCFADQCLSLLNDEGFRITIFRPPMIYGGNNPPGNMQRLVKLVKTGLPLPFNNFNNKRDFINIRNLIAYLEASIKGEKCGIFLVSDYNPVSTARLVEVISEKLNAKNIRFSLPDFALSFIRTIKPDLMEKLYCPLHIDTSETNNILSYLPEYTMEQGIEEMIAFYKTK